MALNDLLQDQAAAERLPLNVVRKEALQVYTLAEIYAQPESQQITFQGGIVPLDELDWASLDREKLKDWAVPFPGSVTRVVFESY